MSSTFPRAVSVGRVIDGRFPLLCRLGGSEWSSAYLTELDERSGKNAAIKLFPVEFVDERATLAQWDVARTLSHPHLMPLHHAARRNVDGEDLFYVVTDYADEILSQILPERPLTTEEALAMLGSVLDALSYLHNLGLTHGHLRPTNIMVIDDYIKLSPDFGWRSRWRSVYDPPEADSGHVSPAADIWSLGILLVEALTQQPPAWDRSHGGEPEVPATIPEPYLAIARECLQVDPARRCTLAGIKAHLCSLAENNARLNPPQIAEPAVQPVEPAVLRTAKPSYKLHAMILTGAVLILLFLIGAFKFGWDLTPSSPWPVLQSSEPAPAAAQPQPLAPKPVPHPTAAPPPPAATAPAPTAKPAPAPAVEPHIGGSVKGSIAHQAMPDVPGNILGAVQGHINVGIRVEVDPVGNVSQASIDSPGPSRYFADQALRAAQNWKFTPAQVDGRAAASTWLLQFQFGQSQIAVTPSQEAP